MESWRKSVDEELRLLSARVRVLEERPTGPVTSYPVGRITALEGEVAALRRIVADLVKTIRTKET
jgi:hypothetical protein